MKRHFARYWREGLLIAVALLAFSVFGFSLVENFSDRYGAYNLQVDSDKYHAWATEIASGSRSEIPKDQPPGFILFLSFLFYLAGPSLLLPKLGNLLFVALNAVCAGLAGKLLFGRAVGLLTFVLTLFSPALLAYAATIQYEVFTAFLLSASVLLCLLVNRASKREYKFALLLVFAIVFAALTLSREVFVFCFPVMLLWLWREAQVGMKAILLCAAVFTSIVGGWSLYQSLQYGEFIPISKKGTFNLHIGNNPNANGTYNLVMVPIEDPRGLAFIAQRPDEAAHLFLRKIGYFFGFIKDGWNVPRYTAVLIHDTSWGVLPYDFSLWFARSLPSFLLLTGVLFISWSPKTRKAWLLPALLLPPIALHGLMISSFRFSVPFAVSFILLGSFALVRMGRITQFLSSRGRVLASIGIASYLAAASFFAPLPEQFTIPAHRLDSFDAQNVQSQNGARYNPVRYLPPTGERRPAVLLTDEFFPAGEFRLSFSVRTDPGSKNSLTLAALDERGSPFCSKNISIKNSEEFADVSVLCALSKTSVIRLALFSNSDSPLWIESLAVRYL